MTLIKIIQLKANLIRMTFETIQKKLITKFASTVFDSSVKSPVGVEYGVEYQFGNFDQCMAIKTDLVKDGVEIASKYCLVDVELEGYVVRKAARRHQKVSFSKIKISF